MNRLFLTMLIAICCGNALAADCATYAGTRAATANELSGVAGKALGAIKSNNGKGLFGMSDGHLLLLRRVVSGSSDDRIGNVRLPMRPRDLDSNLNIRIGSQTFPAIVDRDLFGTVNLGSAVMLQREVCDDPRTCGDSLPSSIDVPFMLNDLLRCNPGNGGVFVFADGAFVLGMRIQGDHLPTGSALFFAKKGSSYRLAGLVVQE